MGYLREGWARQAPSADSPPTLLRGLCGLHGGGLFALARGPLTLAPLITLSLSRGDSAFGRCGVAVVDIGQERHTSAAHVVRRGYRAQ
jgi:hypothetical protein